MGVVDYNRNRRGSWDLLRQEYAPASIASLQFDPEKNGHRLATILLHTRGPIEVDMPVYTLRGYSLHWQVTSPDRTQIFSQGDVPLPTLLPASEWTGEIEFPVPADEYIFVLSIMRPTGFSVMDYVYNQ